MNIILGIQAFKYRLKSWESWENFAGRFPSWFLCGKKNCQRLLVNCSFARQIEHGIKYACGCLTFYFRCMIGCMQNLLVHWPRLKLYENVKSRTLNRVFQVDFVVWCPHLTNYILNLKERTSRAFHITYISLVVQPTNHPPPPPPPYIV